LAGCPSENGSRPATKGTAGTTGELPDARELRALSGLWRKLSTIIPGNPPGRGAIAVESVVASLGRDVQAP